MGEFVNLEISDVGVATIRIDRGKLNPLNDQVALEIGEAVDAIANDLSAKAVVVWGGGSKGCAFLTALDIGELVHAPGVPAILDSGGLNRHTFMCGQSGAGKTYALGLLLERVLSETTLRVVILDPNSDHVALKRLREDADPVRAARYALPLTLAIIGGDPRRFLPYIQLYYQALDQHGHQRLPVAVGFVPKAVVHDLRSLDQQRNHLPLAV